MNAARKTVAWICIFSILFVGCYGSALIDPKGDERERIYSDKIEYIITKDGTKHEFVTPPAIISNALVPKQSVSIPLSDVSQVCVTKFKAAETVLLSVAVAGLSYLIIAEALLVHDMNEAINQRK